MTTKPIYWNPEKNRRLMEERGISFEAVVFSLQTGGLLDDMHIPMPTIMHINGYLWLILTATPI